MRQPSQLGPPEPVVMGTQEQPPQHFQLDSPHSVVFPTVTHNGDGYILAIKRGRGASNIYSTVIKLTPPRRGQF